VEELRLTPEQMRALAQGTIVHDVGKIAIPDAVLNKPGKLTEEERAIIKRHPTVGYEICRRLGFMKDELDIIRSHHEKWDGADPRSPFRSEMRGRVAARLRARSEGVRIPERDDRRAPITRLPCAGESDGFFGDVKSTSGGIVGQKLAASGSAFW